MTSYDTPTRFKVTDTSGIYDSVEITVEAKFEIDYHQIRIQAFEQMAGCSWDDVDERVALDTIDDFTVEQLNNTGTITW